MSYQIGDRVQITCPQHTYDGEIADVIELDTMHTSGLLKLQLVSTAGITRALESDVSMVAPGLSSQASPVARKLYQAGQVVFHTVFACHGTVTQDEQPGDKYLEIETDDIQNPGHLINVKWKPANVVMSATMQASAASASLIVVGDYVKYIGSDPAFRGLRGTVLSILPTSNGADEALVQINAHQNEFIPVDSLLAITASAGHYQAVVQDTNQEPEARPFDHASLGTDLTGDELMKSIRDFCEGNGY